MVLAIVQTKEIELTAGSQAVAFNATVPAGNTIVVSVLGPGTNRPTSFTGSSKAGPLITLAVTLP